MSPSRPVPTRRAADMEQFVNLKLLSHPANWLIVWLVILFGGFAWALVHEGLSSLPNTVES